MKQPVSYYVKKSILIIIAVFIMAVGIELFLFSAFGADSLSVFIQGMQFVANRTFDPLMQYGTCSLVFNGFFLVVALFCARKHIFVGTFLTTFFLGAICNIIEAPMRGMLPAELDLVTRIILMIVGQLVLSIGIGLQIATRFGQTACDAVLFKICDATGVYYKYMRMVFEALCVIGGFLMGGIVGIGTLLCILTTGPLCTFFTKLYNRTILKVLGLSDPLNEMKPEKK